MALRGIKHIPLSIAPGTAFESATRTAEDRHLRRKLITTDGGLEILVDLGLPAFFQDGDHLELEDGRYLEIQAADEELYEIRGASPAHISQLAWHLGNRHLAAQIEYERILIKRDPVIKDMLLKLHATVTEATEQFDPVHGAYAHGH
jgi:urease accessory protein